MNKFLTLGLVLAVMATPLLAGALGESYQQLMNDVCNNRGPFDPGCVKLENEAGLLGLIMAFLWLLRTIFWILSVFFLLFAAYSYLVGGATGKVDKAKDLIKYAIIAMIIALVATSIPYLIKSILT